MATRKSRQAIQPTHEQDGQQIADDHSSEFDPEKLESLPSTPNAIVNQEGEATQVPVGHVAALRIYQDLLRAIATHRVADRPDRYEPRLIQRRRNHFECLTKPRKEVKRIMAKGVTEI